MVRLKPKELIMLRRAIKGSQFHNGSIKTILMVRPKFLRGQSQFHNGSIKTEYSACIVTPPLSSQFHNGSIKTKHQAEIQFYGLESLNSTMVRLKLNKFTLTEIKKGMSQFHNGSIKTM